MNVSAYTRGYYDEVIAIVSAITQFDGPVFRAFEGHSLGADGADPGGLPNSGSRAL